MSHNALDLPALETSFDLIAARGDALMGRFYSRLFAAAPEARPLFAHTDMRHQKKMLLSALGLVRRSLRDLDRVVPVLRDLGARHVAYGAQPEHYPVVAQSLVAAMADIAGAAWEPRFAAAWVEALDVVARVMLDGARQAQEAAAAA